MFFFFSCNNSIDSKTKNVTVDSSLKTSDSVIIKPEPVTKHTVSDTETYKPDNEKKMEIDFSGPSTIIYKTKENYYDKIPIMMNDAKTKIISYPSPKDVFYKGQLSYPTKLSSNYLLDNRGVGKNSVFINITYEEYKKRTESFLLEDMIKMILDKNPFSEIYNCGNRYQYKNIESDLNKMIENNQLNKFIKIL